MAGELWQDAADWLLSDLLTRLGKSAQTLLMNLVLIGFFLSVNYSASCVRNALYFCFWSSRDGYIFCHLIRNSKVGRHSR